MHQGKNTLETLMPHCLWLLNPRNQRTDIIKLDKVLYQLSLLYVVLGQSKSGCSEPNLMKDCDTDTDLQVRPWCSPVLQTILAYRRRVVWAWVTTLTFRNQSGKHKKSARIIRNIGDAVLNKELFLFWPLIMLMFCVRTGMPGWGQMGINDQLSTLWEIQRCRSCVECESSLVLPTPGPVGRTT